MPTPDIFQQVTASSDGEYLWSNPLNWTEGTPTNGDSVVVGALGFEDLASLSLASLTLNAGGRVAVTGASLDVTTVTMAGGTEVLADAADAGAPVMVTLGTVDGSAGYIVANGAGARLIDQSAVDQGETYYVGDGGFVELTAAPSSASILAYISTPAPSRWPTRRRAMPSRSATSPRATPSKCRATRSATSTSAPTA